MIDDIKIIDTHTHLYLPEFENDEASAVERAIDSGVSHMIFPNVDISSIEPMKALASRFPEHVSMGMGLHPSEVNTDWQTTLATIMETLDDGSEYVAVGEIGIDLYWDKTYASQQMQVFDIQVARAEELNLPIIIHCREGLDQTLEVLKGHPGVHAVFHSFGGTPEDVERIRRVGDYYFGINGIVTFKNCKVRESLPTITLDRLLLETDSPYLAPVPHRGKRNESSFIKHTAAHIAQYLDVPLSVVSSRTTDNAYRLFPKLISH